jgi:hypothetical protein
VAEDVILDGSVGLDVDGKLDAVEVHEFNEGRVALLEKTAAFFPQVNEVEFFEEEMVEAMHALAKGVFEGGWESLAHGWGYALTVTVLE